MPQTDLYSLLRAYAHKNHSPYVDIESFLDFLEKYAIRKAPEHPEWQRWVQGTEMKFWADLPPLAENEKCVLLADTSKGRIYMPSYCRELLREIYSNLDKLADIPFPGEESLKITIPENHLRVVNLNSDMGTFFGLSAEKGGKNEKNGENQEAVIKLLFPQDYGAALLPSSMIPRKLMELSFLKIRHYLRSKNNKDYTLNKLIPQFQGKEKYLREIIDQIIYRPVECLNDMEKSADFPYLFWTYFCPMVKNDIKRRNEFLNEDLAALQAVCIIEICSSFYRTAAAKKREVNVAFKTLEVRMERSPWSYTMDDIIRFTNDKDVPLLNIYSKQELEEYIQQNITEADNNDLPSWLVIQGAKGERWFIKKEKYLALCTKMLIEMRPDIKKALTKRWINLIREFGTEPAMEKDSEFDKLLAVHTESVNPTLITMLEDPKLLWVYEELNRIQGAIPPSSRIFKDGRPVPMSVIYALRRKDLLADARMALPLWYSIPALAAIFAFFKNFGRKKKKKQTTYRAAGDDGFIVKEKDPNDLQYVARSVQTALVPQGKTLDGYLSELEEKWSRLLDKKARQNLIYDVQSLLRDNLRRAVRVHKRKKITRKGLSEMAAFLIARTPALHSLGAPDALRIYMELYMSKQLLTFRL
jgi:hypothetical protein